MSFDSYSQWFTATFVAIGAICVLAALWLLFYVRRRAYRPRNNVLAMSLAPYVEVHVSSEDIVDVRREVWITFQRSLPLALIGMSLGLIAGAFAFFSLDSLFQQRVGDLQTISSSYRSLPLVSPFPAASCIFNGMSIGASLGALTGVVLAPRDRRRSQAPAQRVGDLLSLWIVVMAFAPVVAYLGFSIYCSIVFPTRDTAMPLLDSFPWLAYVAPFITLCSLMLTLGSISLLCRIGPRRWTSRDNVAEVIDRYCRTRFISFVLALSLGQTFFLFFQLSLLGNLYEQVFELINPWSMAIYLFGVFWSFIPFFILVANNSSGQLGGRLTGWPWQKRATPQAAA